jgi:hypothetical protein
MIKHHATGLRKVEARVWRFHALGLAALRGAAIRHVEQCKLIDRSTRRDNSLNVISKTC